MKVSASVGARALLTCGNIKVRSGSSRVKARDVNRLILSSAIISCAAKGDAKEAETTLIKCNYEALWGPDTHVEHRIRLTLRLLQ